MRGPAAGIHKSPKNCEAAGALVSDPPTQEVEESYGGQSSSRSCNGYGKLALMITSMRPCQDGLAEVQNYLRWPQAG
jgi:hypothetical protein